MLDEKIEHIHHHTLPKLGLWLARTFAVAENKVLDIQKRLDQLGIHMNILWPEWKHQIKAQTKPLPSESLCNTVLYWPTIVQVSQRIMPINLWRKFSAFDRS